MLVPLRSRTYCFYAAATYKSYLLVFYVRAAYKSCCFMLVPLEVGLLFYISTAFYMYLLFYISVAHKWYLLFYVCSVHKS